MLFTSACKRVEIVCSVDIVINTDYRESAYREQQPFLLGIWWSLQKERVQTIGFLLCCDTVFCLMRRAFHKKFVEPIPKVSLQIHVEEEN